MESASLQVRYRIPEDDTGTHDFIALADAMIADAYAILGHYSGQCHACATGALMMLVVRTAEKARRDGDRTVAPVRHPTLADNGVRPSLPDQQTMRRRIRELLREARHAYGIRVDGHVARREV